MVAAGSGAAAVAALKKETYGVVPASELEKPYDVVIIGGGPAGVAAASHWSPPLCG